MQERMGYLERIMGDSADKHAQAIHLLFCDFIVFLLLLIISSSSSSNYDSNSHSNNHHINSINININSNDTTTTTTTNHNRDNNDNDNDNTSDDNHARAGDPGAEGSPREARRGLHQALQERLLIST